jgi:rod shape-determining protein MreC
VALSRRTGRSRFTLLLLILTSLTVITLDFRGESSGFIESVRETALDAFAPVRDAAGTAFSPVSNAWNGIFNYDDLEEERDRLKAELADARGALDRANVDDARAEEIFSNAKIPFVRDVPLIPARVITDPISNFELSFEIDAGRDDGVKEGMTVVAGEGLVGRIVRVSINRSVVQLVTDREFAVGVRLERSNETGLAEGRGRENPLEGSLISPDVDVRKADDVFTSGLIESKAFPPDIPVGTVTSVKKSEGGLEQRLRIRPAVDVEHLVFVSVMDWTPGR